MRTIQFLGLLMSSVVLIALVLAATFATYGYTLHGPFDRVHVAVNLTAVFGIMLVVSIVFAIREYRRRTRAH